MRPWMAEPQSGTGGPPVKTQAGVETAASLGIEPETGTKAANRVSSRAAIGHEAIAPMLIPVR